MKTLLVTGSNGQLAREYQRSHPVEGWDCVFFTREELDISDIQKIEETVISMKFDAILNLAAYTDVEKAESLETEKCFKANSLGPQNLARICKRLNIPLIHISTDYVFDGSKEESYVEEDDENPLNDYGRTKFVGEKFIQEECDWYYILRVSWVYSNHTKNFFTTMLNLAQERNELNVVEDQTGSPTSTKEICRAIDSVLLNLEPSLSGIYHFSGNGKTTWKDFAAEIFRQCRVPMKINGVLASSWPSKVKRPVNSYMSSEKFSKAFSYRPMHWKNALTEIVSERKILPIKVGDRVITEGVEHVIVSTDWQKRVANLSPIDDMKKTVEFPFDILIHNEK